MRRYSVEVELVTRDPDIRRRVSGAYGGEPKTWMAVFADNSADARVTAVEKVHDKWLRHHDLATYWIAHAAHEVPPGHTKPPVRWGVR
jgi:hypothetical protein